MEKIVEIASEFWSVLGGMSPYLLGGFLVAGVLSVYVSTQTVQRHLGGRGIWPVVKASAFGVPLPLCSCSVIPVSASLRKHGASNAAATSFLISTPQTGVDSIFVTYSLLGGVFAIFRPIVAFISGIIGGVIVGFGRKEGQLEAVDAEPHTDTCCNTVQSGKFARIMRFGFVTLARDIGWPLLIGLLVAALISAMMPKDFFASYVPRGAMQILVLMAAGIPVYVCATASVPIAFALIMQAGASPGAAFAFLMTGPATNAATIGTVWKVMGPRTAVIYLGTMIGAAFGGGILLDGIYSWQSVTTGPAMGWMLPEWFKTVCAVILLGVLLNAILLRRRESHGGAEHVHEDKCEQDKQGDSCHE